MSIGITATAYRDRMAAEFGPADAGIPVRVVGWVHRRRDLGGLIFLELRDRSGRLQLSLGPGWTPGPVLERARRVGSEWVIAVRGTIELRPRDAVNPDLPTGEIELHVADLEVLTEADTPPIPVAPAGPDELPAEELRLRYRYLDLRRDDLQRALITRHRVLQLVRSHLSGRGFLEIETPILTRRTPEGARDYLVPSRVHPGEFYALPQSPQLYKQLLMVSGFDRYFQMARCLRDEDLRADRQPEFTQIDAEMSFVSEDDVFREGEAMLAALWREVLGVDIAVPFPRMSYREALAAYGTDKPDLRLGMEIRDLTDVLARAEFRLFHDALAAGDRIRAFVAPGGAALSRRELDELATIARAAGAAGALWLRRSAEGLAGSFAKALDDVVGASLNERAGLGVGDLLVVVMGRSGADTSSAPTACDAALDALRRHLGARLGRRDPTRHDWLWVTEFPLFDFDAEAGRLVAMHHPFTMPHPDDVPALLEATDGPLAAEAARALHRLGLRSRAYDAVYNGSELASGSIRIHDPVLQKAVFRALGIGEAEAQAKFGFLLEAFRFGVPPHGGFAFGFDRMVMLLVGAASLRDVIAFPKTTAARALFEGAPSPVSATDLRELHIMTTGPGARTDPVG
jgi:aspartyl-tRNA synthetase